MSALIARKRHKKDPATFSDPETLVTFLVGGGENPKRFIIHKEFACAATPVFEAAFNSEFIEGQTQTYTLDDTTEGAFRFLSQWMYGEKLCVDLLVPGRNPSTSANPALKRAKRDVKALDAPHGKQELDDLIRVWVLADKLQIPKLQNFAVDMLFQIREEYSAILILQLKLVYKETSSDSPLRNFFLEQCYSLGPDYIKKRYIYSLMRHLQIW